MKKLLLILTLFTPIAYGKTIHSTLVEQATSVLCYYNFCKVTVVAPKLIPELKIKKLRTFEFCYFSEHYYSAAAGVNIDCSIFNAVEELHFRGKKK